MSGTGDAARDGDAGRAGGSDVLTAVAEMAAAALADAGMPALHRQAQTFPSFRQRPAAGDTDAAAEAGAAAAEAEAAAGPAPPHMLFLAFRWASLCLSCGHAVPYQDSGVWRRMPTSERGYSSAVAARSRGRHHGLP